MTLPRSTTVGSSVKDPAGFDGRIAAYLVDVLARELSDKLVETAGVGLNTGSAENVLNVISGRRVVTAESEEEVGSKVLHCGKRWRWWVALRVRVGELFDNRHPPRN